ncbi:MAG TPA: winged helix-turn-helix domain-containing protein [Methylomirabilota bacterium]|nr:winged helix-turn-helix domain-containing protein [Methylomirabilota bacterium]
MPSTGGTVFEVGAAFRLGDRLVEPRLNRLTRDGEPIQIEIKAMDVLLCLVRRAGEVVTRQEIVDAVWATEFISDNTLTHAVAELRNALGDDARAPTFIETIHRRGYRLITPVEPADPEDRATGTLARFPVSKTLADGARNPYPGLAAFTESDAELFFGREAEVAALWRKLTTRRLLAVIGPSGVGKSSLLRAGLIPAAPAGWAVRICQPGEAPFSALARALAPDFSDDPGALAALFELAANDTGFAVISRWRRRHDQALVIVDQLEELFTQSPPEVQARFAELLGRLAREADIHVLLAMRDDFVYRCHAFDALKPVFDALTPISQPAPEALARALALPAKRCGYTFDDDDLVGRMVAEVAEERAALPLLAFTAARLWEERDRDNRLLTRQAYEDMGGIHGALAGHAEATVAAIGAGRLPVVREIFRNLVTAEGTRATREVGDLLSVFDGGTETLSSRASEASRGIPQRQERNEKATVSAPGGDPSTRPSDGLAQDDRGRAAAEVLSALINARLLTSYEVTTEDGATHRTVEIVHESLLAAWPRLVRWQAQDAEGALLRDQLRQAARIWNEHDRSDDLLWTGSAFREFAVWRERYPGGLSELEEDFAAAMTSLATRRRRRRRIAAAAALAFAVVVAAVFGTLWRRSVQETRRAEAEAAQREAAQLLALGRLKLADSPNAALAFAIASLERADNDPARHFAVEALWQGPPGLFLTDLDGALAWSADGRWLAGTRSGLVLLDRDTGERRRLSSTLDHPVGFTPDGRWLITRASMGAPTILHLWALPEGRLERTLRHPEESHPLLVGDRLLSFEFDLSAPQGERPAIVRHLPSDGSPAQVLGRWQPHGLTSWDIDPTGTWILSLQGGHLLEHRLDDLDAPGRQIGTHPGDAWLRVRPWRDLAVTGDSNGEVRIWNLRTASLERTLESPADARRIALDPTGRFVVTGPVGMPPPMSVVLFDLAAPPTTEPVPLAGSEMPVLSQLDFSPDGSWCAAAHGGYTVILWNVTGARANVLGQEGPDCGLAFTPAGDLLSSNSRDGALHRWPLSPASGENRSELLSRPGAFLNGCLDVDPAGRFAVGSENDGGDILVVPLDGSQASTRTLARKPGTTLSSSYGGTLDPSGSLVAVGVRSPGHPEENGIRVVDLVTGDERTLDTHPKGTEKWFKEGSDNEGFASPAWLPDGRLVSDGDAGLLLWDLTAGTSRRLRPCQGTPLLFVAAGDPAKILGIHHRTATGWDSSLSVFDLATGLTRKITSHGNKINPIAVDPRGVVLVSGGVDGVVRVGPLSGEEPHLLFGHTRPLYEVAVSGDGHRIASCGGDGPIRLWPMPDLTKPPLHTLPHDELLAKLHSLTNLRAVRDPASDTGWTIEIGPFPGWATVPEWQP